MRPLSSSLQPNRRYLLLLALLLVGLYILVPQFSDFHSSWHLLSHPNLTWTAAAIGLTALTYLAATFTYSFLAFKPLFYGQTLVIQLAAMFINRLLPGGLGALGANYAYLRRKRHSTTQATSVVAVNNLLGLVGHAMLLGLILALSLGDVMVSPPGHSRTLASAAKYIAAAAALVILLGLALGWGRLRRFALSTRSDILSYRRRPWRLAAALASSMALTLSNVLCLSCCMLAIGVHLPFIVALLIFTFGVGAGTATPTPGGLGGFEAGLTAGLIAYHVASPTALATALLYRLVSYWLPLPIGALALIGCQRKHLL